ncbi:response regulator transcription factor [Hufsiella ginkgonis]|uniref:Response regulator n=1 Tax=Hufsiella ginkgonis TaxID=2695274 RepID=A0A7K1XTY9_9SPHI|nr:response regulator transcription factor [Hufsiella ginkgonis]MXV14278.1 response regulator [Hufsiella ginkgonis]
MKEKIRVAIVDDHTLFRRGIAALLSEFDDLEIVMEAEHGVQLIELLGRMPAPHLVLMDINMPRMDGYETTGWLREHHPSVYTLALSMYEDEDAIIKMVRCGAIGYILKKMRPRELLEAIKTVVEKGIYINELVSGKLLRSVLSDDTDPKISPKEIEFLRYCCSDLTYKEIADKMCVSPRTVDNYRDSLLQKLHIKSRSGLILYAIKKRIFSLS